VTARIPWARIALTVYVSLIVGVADAQLAQEAPAKYDAPITTSLKGSAPILPSSHGWLPPDAGWR
jgi:hypothetical protein